jgi:peptide-methionine (R)-S-oxide reductase
MAGKISASGYDLGPIEGEERERLAARLTDEERWVLLDHGTERPFCGGLLKNKEEGVYGGRVSLRRLIRSTYGT